MVKTWNALRCMFESCDGTGEYVKSDDYAELRKVCDELAEKLQMISNRDDVGVAMRIIGGSLASYNKFIGKDGE